MEKGGREEEKRVTTEGGRKKKRERGRKERREGEGKRMGREEMRYRRERKGRKKNRREEILCHTNFFCSRYSCTSGSSKSCTMGSMVSSNSCSFSTTCSRFCSSSLNAGRREEKVRIKKKCVGGQKGHRSTEEVLPSGAGVSSSSCSCL